jgi:cation transport regulator
VGNKRKGGSVPYKNLDDLPTAINKNLPKHAQEIYRSTFNSAWDEYSSEEDRDEGSSREETSHKVAWSAVKKKYKKNNNKWVKKED